MNTYEVMYILRPDLDEEATAAAVAKYSGIVTNNGGEILETNTIGKRRLAYEIDKMNEGYYVLISFKGKSEVSQELDRIMRISDDVMRYLILRKD